MAPLRTRLRFPMAAYARNAARLVVGYALAAAAGWAAAHAAIPLAWVLGPLVVAAILSLSGVRILAPVALRRCGQLVIGCTGGLHVTGAAVLGLFEWLPVMVATALASILVSATFSGVFAWLGRLDRKTAFFALMPGGLSEMGNIGSAVGARMEPIALLHSFRVAIVVLVIPALLVANVELTPLAPQPDLPIAMVGLLLLAGLAGAALVDLAGLNNPWMVGALIASGVISALGLMSGRMPHDIFAAGQVLLGYNIGSRFKPDTFRKLPRVAAAGVAVILMMMGAMALYAWGLSALTGLDLAASILVSSPGGTSEMTTTAQSLHLQVALVTAFHLVRTLLVNGFATHYWRAFDRTGYLDAVEALCRRLSGRL